MCVENHGYGSVALQDLWTGEFEKNKQAEDSQLKDGDAMGLGTGEALKKQVVGIFH